MPSTLTILPAAETDLPDLMHLLFSACDSDPFHLAVWGPTTSPNLLRAGARFLAKWRATPTLRVLKCIDQASHCIAAFCLWDITTAQRSETACMLDDHITSCDWLAGRERDIARAYLRPALQKRWETMRGRPCALLTYLCTRPAMRRRGPAAALVGWGLRVADEVGVPAYCEASEMGVGVYGKMGFERVGTVRSVVDGEVVGEYPVMVMEVRG